MRTEHHLDPVQTSPNLAEHSSQAIYTGILPRIIPVLLLTLPLLGQKDSLTSDECVDYKKHPTAFHRFVEKTMAETYINGLTLGVTNKKEITWREAYGLRERTHSKPMEEDTVFRLASVSKVLVTTNVTQLAQAGLLDLDQDINLLQVPGTDKKLLPFEVVNPHQPNGIITMRMIIDFVSSIKDNNSVMDQLRGSDVSLAEFALNYFSSRGLYYSGDNFCTQEPGKVYIYSNAATALAGYIVGLVMADTYAQACADLLFQPLGMNHSAWQYEDLSPAAKANFATAYQYQSRVRVYLGQPVIIYPFYPSGGMRSNVDDLASYMRLLLNDGNHEGVQLLKKGTTQSFGRGLDLTCMTKYKVTEGAMWYRVKLPGVNEILYKNGLYNGSTSLILLDEKSQRGYVALANLSSNTTTLAVFKILLCMAHADLTRPHDGGHDAAYKALVDMFTSNHCGGCVDVSWPSQ